MSDHDTEFGLFDPTQEVEKHYRNLPHWFQPGATVFETFRTKDSLPRGVVHGFHEELSGWLTARGHAADSVWEPTSLNPAEVREFRRLKSQLLQHSLDSCHGACRLRDPRAARIVGDAIMHFNAARYDIDSFVIMPNHVHVLVQFRAPWTLKKVLAGWQRYTATEINRLFGMTGDFWRGEGFDHLVRSPEQFAYLQRYIAGNPVKAKLRQGEFLYWSRSHE